MILSDELGAAAESLEAIFADMRDADDLNLAYHPVRTLSHGERCGASIQERKAARRDGQAWFVANDLESRRPELSQRLSSYLKTATGTRPAQKWMKALSSLIAPDLREDFAALIVAMTEAAFPDNGCYFDDRMRGLLWAAALCDPPPVAPALTRFAKNVCYRSFPGVGVNNEALGNACLVALANMPDGAGIPYLSRLLAGVKFPKIKQRIATTLDEAAAKAGMMRGELEEVSAPTHDLSADGKLEWPVGGGAALIAIDGATSVALTWRTPDGTVAKSMPAALKSAADDVRAIRARIKEIEADLSVLPWRIHRAHGRNAPRSAARPAARSGARQGVAHRGKLPARRRQAARLQDPSRLRQHPDGAEQPISVHRAEAGRRRRQEADRITVRRRRRLVDHFVESRAARRRPQDQGSDDPRTNPHNGGLRLAHPPYEPISPMFEIGPLRGMHE
jgi:hypothetical protein